MKAEPFFAWWFHAILAITILLVVAGFGSALVFACWRWALS